MFSWEEANDYCLNNYGTELVSSGDNEARLFFEQWGVEEAFNGYTFDTLCSSYVLQSNGYISITYFDCDTTKLNAMICYNSPCM